jgi:hypothetical protein
VGSLLSAVPIEPWPAFKPWSRDRALLVVWAVLENLGYRQLTVWWRLRGVASYLRRKKSWGKMTRKGFNPAEESDASFGEGDSLAAWARSKKAAAMAANMPMGTPPDPDAEGTSGSGSPRGRSLQDVR